MLTDLQKNKTPDLYVQPRGHPNELPIAPAEASALMRHVASRLDAALAQTIRHLKCLVGRLGRNVWFALLPIRGSVYRA